VCVCVCYMVQVASRALGVPIELIHISETASHVVANAVITAASSSSELWGSAIVVRQFVLLLDECPLLSSVHID